jgi:hypothetical protein
MPAPQGPAERKAMQVMHDVYFYLTDRSPAARDTLVQECLKWLPGHDGILRFNVGTRVEEHTRDVNVLDYDVAITVLFESKAAHDAYQHTSERHKKFVERNKPSWAKVRVFDSYLKG